MRRRTTGLVPCRVRCRAASPRTAAQCATTQCPDRCRPPPPPFTRSAEARGTATRGAWPLGEPHPPSGRRCPPAAFRPARTPCDPVRPAGASAPAFGARCPCRDSRGTPRLVTICCRAHGRGDGGRSADPDVARERYAAGPRDSRAGARSRMRSRGPHTRGRSQWWWPAASWARPPDAVAPGRRSPASSPRSSRGAFGAVPPRARRRPRGRGRRRARLAFGWGRWLRGRGGMPAPHGHPSRVSGP